MCNMCDSYKKESEKYKRKYEAAKSGLNDNERNTLIELICSEQTSNLIPHKEYSSDKYNMLESLKAKIRVM